MQQNRRERREVGEPSSSSSSSSEEEDRREPYQCSPSSSSSASYIEGESDTECTCSSALNTDIGTASASVAPSHRSHQSSPQVHSGGGEVRRRKKQYKPFADLYHEGRAWFARYLEYFSPVETMFPVSVQKVFSSWLDTFQSLRRRSSSVAATAGSSATTGGGKNKYSSGGSVGAVAVPIPGEGDNEPSSSGNGGAPERVEKGRGKGKRRAKSEEPILSSLNQLKSSGRPPSRRRAAAGTQGTTTSSGDDPLSLGEHPASMWSLVDAPMVPPKAAADARKLTVVLDLDETVCYARGDDGKVHVRPYWNDLRAFLEQHCEVIVWTAGARDHAKKVLKILDPQVKVVRHCVYRHHKWFAEDFPSVYCKDLSRLRRPLEWTVVVDNTAECCVSNPKNAIIVRDFCGPSFLTAAAAGAGAVTEEEPPVPSSLPLSLNGDEVESRTAERENEEVGDDDLTLLVLRDILTALVSQGSPLLGSEEEERPTAIAGALGQPLAPAEEGTIRVESQDSISTGWDFSRRLSTRTEEDEKGEGLPLAPSPNLPVVTVPRFLRKCPDLLPWDCLTPGGAAPVTMYYLCTDRLENSRGGRISSVRSRTTSAGWLELVRSTRSRREFDFYDEEIVSSRDLPHQPQQQQQQQELYLLQTKSELIEADTLLVDSSRNPSGLRSGGNSHQLRKAHCQGPGSGKGKGLQ